MANRVDRIFCLVTGLLVSSAWLIIGASSLGTGTQSDPFIAKELTMDARFVSQGDQGIVYINGNSVGTSNHGGVFNQDNLPINDYPTPNTITLYSNFDSCGKKDCNALGFNCKTKCDDCGFDSYNDHVMAVFRIGSDSDNNIIWTQSSGWDAGGHTINEAPAGSCYFNPNGWGSIDFPWTDQEKCVNTVVCSNCCETRLSKTFYVKQGDCKDSSQCTNKCEGSVRKYSGVCAQNKCSYTTEDCNPKDGWYDTGEWAYYSCQRCKPQEYRDYSCSSGSCTYAVTNTRQVCENINEGNVCNTDPYSCKDDCTAGQRQYTCQSGQCAFSAWINLNSCFPHSCYQGSCGPCSRSCGAECGSSTDCPNKCEGNARYFNSVCTSQCTCSYSQEDCGSKAICSNSICVPKPFLSVSAGLSANTIRVGEKSTLTGNAECSNANCGNVYVHAKNTSGISINSWNGLSVQGNNPYDCTYMSANPTTGDSCSPSWSITGLNSGSYEMYLIATNGSGLTNTSNTVTLTVGEIPVGSISASLSAASTVTLGTTTTVKTIISCSGDGAYCGNITSHLYYNGTLMATSGNLFTYSANPQTPSACKELWSGQTCSAEWVINSSKTGSYLLGVTADSDNPKIANATAQAQLDVRDKPVGVIKIESLYLTKNQIATSETTALGADAICASSDSSTTVSCGRVMAYSRSNAAKITSTGNVAVPVPVERDCGIMNPTSNICKLYWNITGNSVGSYMLDIFAYSDSSEVKSIASENRTLNVIKNMGSLSVSKVEVSPKEVNLTKTTTLSVAIECSKSYCGSVTARLKLEPGDWLSSTTPVSTQQNEKGCSSLPCNLQWSLTGNSEGSFTINATATSNESIHASNTTTVVVKGPNPLLSLTSNLTAIKNITTGQPVKITANVKCYTKDCGQVNVNLSYNTQEGWKNIPYGKVYLTQQSPQKQNPVVISYMYPDQSADIVWEVNFTETGMREMGIFASGSAPNVTSAQQTGVINVTPAGKVDIGIMLPKPDDTFLKGDVLSLKARITRDGEPLTGLSKVAATIPEILTAELYDDGNHNDGSPNDGVYGGSATVPSGKSITENRYRMIFNAGGYEKSLYVYISPTLYVSVNTDKSSYIWGDNITISGEVRKRGAKVDANITIRLECGSWDGYVNLIAAGSYTHAYENIYMPRDTGCNLKLNVTGEDSYGNKGLNSTEVSITAYKGDLYSVSFDMEKYNYSRGKNMPIAVKVAYVNSPQAGVSVKCSFLGNEVKLNEKDGSYTRLYLIPSDAPLGEQTLSCHAMGPKSEKPGSGNIKINIEPVPLNISIVNPQILPNNILYVFSENNTVLTVKLRYPDDKLIDDAIVQVIWRNQIINMTHAGNGTYITQGGIMFQGAGVDTLVLQALDSEGNYGSSSITLVVNPGQFNMWWLILIPVGMLMFFIAWNLYTKSKEEPPRIEIREKIIRLPVRESVREVVYRPVRMPAPATKIDPRTKLKNEIASLEEKQKTTQNAKELAEQQYYKRQIDEKMFNKLMQDYEEKLIEIDAAIRQKKKQLSEMGSA